MFSLLFFMIHESLINQAFIFMTFICLGIHQENVPILRRLKYQTAWTTKPYKYQQRPVVNDLGVSNHSHNCDSFVVSLGGLEEKASMSKCVFDLLNYLC